MGFAFTATFGWGCWRRRDFWGHGLLVCFCVFTDCTRGLSEREVAPHKSCKLPGDLVIVTLELIEPLRVQPGSCTQPVAELVNDEFGPEVQQDPRPSDAVQGIEDGQHGPWLPHLPGLPGEPVSGDG